MQNVSKKSALTNICVTSTLHERRRLTFSELPDGLLVTCADAGCERLQAWSLMMGSREDLMGTHDDSAKTEEPPEMAPAAATARGPCACARAAARPAASARAADRERAARGDVGVGSSSGHSSSCSARGRRQDRQVHRRPGPPRLRAREHRHVDREWPRRRGGARAAALEHERARATRARHARAVQLAQPWSGQVMACHKNARLN